MIIETKPCDNCDCSPAFCDGDIEICMLTRNGCNPISDEKYEAENVHAYEENEMKAVRCELNRVYRGTVPMEN